MLLSEPFKVGLQCIVLLHAGVKETLKRDKTEPLTLKRGTLKWSSALQPCCHLTTLINTIQTIWISAYLWIPVPVSSQMGFRRCSPPPSFSSSSSEQLFLPPSAPCVSAEPPGVCTQVRSGVRYTCFSFFIKCFWRALFQSNKTQLVWVYLIWILTWLPPAVFLGPSFWLFCPECWPDELWLLTASPAHLQTEKQTHRELIRSPELGNRTNVSSVIAGQN